MITFLKEWADKEGVVTGDKIIIENYLTQNDIAQIICTSRQTATQLINELEEQKAISYSRKSIVIEKRLLNC
jgi:CRP/FNR family transcriptional regulator